jgi:type II secretion system protein H
MLMWSTKAARRGGPAADAHARGDRGFTLVEMLVVLAIMSVLLAVGAPSLKAFSQSRKLKTAASSIRSLCIYARDSAMAEGEAYVVVFGFTEQLFWLAQEASLENGDLAQTFGRGAVGPDAQEEMAESGQTSVGLTRGVLGQQENIVNGVQLARIDVDRGGEIVTTITDYDYITFRPDGTAEPASVYLVNREDNGIVVDVPLAAARTKARSLSDQETESAGLSGDF